MPKRQTVHDWKHSVTQGRQSQLGELPVTKMGRSSLLKLILVILETMDIMRWSQDLRRGEEKAGEVRSMCWSLGMEN